MSRHQAIWRLVPLGLATFFAPGQDAWAQNVLPASPQGVAGTTRPESVVLQALLANPITAPYRITTTYRNRQVVLSGKVGTRLIHDTAVRVAMGTGYPIRDDLVIDTNELNRLVAAGASASAAAMPPTIASLGGSASYVYPPPLFGRLDDPFFGFEPPIISYPPWWRAVTYREPIRMPAQAGVGGMLGPGMPPVVDPNASSPTSVPLGPDAKDGAVEMTLDPQGVAVLRGKVPTLADRVAVGQKIAQTPGVTQVINLLETNNAPSDTPPPPPQPAPDPTVEPQPPLAPVDGKVPTDNEANVPVRPHVAVDGTELGTRLGQAFARRPALAGLPIKLSTRDGVAYLSGKVPSVYEAMLAYRAAQQTPGVRDVDDSLEFVVPDDERKNPLIQKGRPEDVEPYLAAQIRRQVGDLAHIDRVELRGETLELRGTLLRQEDRPRLDAILRSMPVLRGFRLEPELVIE